MSTTRTDRVGGLKLQPGEMVEMSPSESSMFRVTQRQHGAQKVGFRLALTVPPRAMTELVMAVQKALRSATARHALLRCVAHEERAAGQPQSRIMWLRPQQPVDVRVRPRPLEAGWRAAWREMEKEPAQLGQRAIDAVVLASDHSDRCEVLLGFGHWAADAATITTVMHDFLEALASGSDEGEPEADMPPLPVSAEGALKQDLLARGRLGKAALIARTAGYVIWKLLTGAKSSLLTPLAKEQTSLSELTAKGHSLLSVHRLDAMQLDAAVAACRRHQVTLTAWLAAAWCIALGEQIQAHGKSAPVVVNSFILADMKRRHAEPVSLDVASWHTSALIGPRLAVQRPEQNAERLPQLAQQTMAELRLWLERGFLLPMMLTEASGLKRLAAGGAANYPTLATTAISTFGSGRLRTVYGAYQLVQVHPLANVTHMGDVPFLIGFRHNGGYYLTVAATSRFTEQQLQSVGERTVQLMANSDFICGETEK